MMILLLLSEPGELTVVVIQLVEYIWQPLWRHGRTGHYLKRKRGKPWVRPPRAAKKASTALCDLQFCLTDVLPLIAFTTSSHVIYTDLVSLLDEFSFFEKTYAAFEKALLEQLLYFLII